MIGALENVFYIALVLLGFGFVIFIHELGHFAAARWAKIRVHEFAVGFGPAMVSYRKGIGVRRGSTNTTYAAMLRKKAHELGGTSAEHLTHLPGVSDTEYRLNWIPLGGYVKMLGQEDANPGATSAAPDSYTSVPVWKRMVVVSAGVIMNVILAAILFVIVYSVGLESNAPAVRVYEDTPAYAGGMRTGDIVRSVNGHDVEVFQDLVLQVGLSKKGPPLVIEVERPGEGLLTLNVEPEYDAAAEIRAIGAFAMPGATIVSPPDEQRERFDRMATAVGLDGLRPGMTLASVNGEPVEQVAIEPWGSIALPTAVLRAAEDSGGALVRVSFTPAAPELDELAQPVSFEFLPRPDLDATIADANGPTRVEHLMGLTPLLSVRYTEDNGVAAGLRTGDVFVRLGELDYPNTAQGIGAIRAQAGGTIEAVVLRDGERVELSLPVDDAGRVGFMPTSALDHPILATTPTPSAAYLETLDEDDHPADTRRTGAIAGELTPGARIIAVDSATVTSFVDLRSALQSATMDAAAEARGATVELTLADDAGERTVAWELDATGVQHLHTLGWSGEQVIELFAPAMVLQVGSDPGHSVALGLRETQRMLTRVYLTLGRLADGSVKPQQLKGPVGITHIGSRVARDGVIRLLFFIGLISANLAVLNFLPLPIVDGGLFLMLVYEGIFKKPVPVAVQNAFTLIGLVVIAAVFLFVTTNDVLNLF